MFLSVLRRRNPRFLAAIAALHQAGDVPANCCVLDLDAVAANAAAIAGQAAKFGMSVFAMTKQVGRNPDFCRTIARAGITHAVGVDVQCAAADARAGLQVGHLGHLVQVPRHSADTAAALAPSYWTVFSMDKAREASDAARRAGRVQPVLVRVTAPGDVFYRGHEGGFPAGDIVEVARRIDALPYLRCAGVTSFPTALFDKAAGHTVATANLGTLARAADDLRKAGFEQVQLNAPGTTCAAMLPMLAQAGTTQVEPGHGLTGTTPWHATEDVVEVPAMAYVSEISHIYGGEAFVFGGGLYSDPVLGQSPTQALVVPQAWQAGTASEAGPAELAPVDVAMPAASAIDYYATLEASPTMRTGDTVIFGFRQQVFVTRALTAGISGVASGHPRVEGIWPATGAPESFFA